MPKFKLSQKSCDQFDKIYKEVWHRPADRYNIATRKQVLYRGARTIYAFMQYFLATKELVDFIIECRRLACDENVVVSEKNPYIQMLKRFKRVADFYEFHKERNDTVTDQRYELLNVLRRDVQLIILFLRQRTRKCVPPS